MRLELHMSLDSEAMRDASGTQVDAVELATLLGEIANYVTNSWHEGDGVKRIRDRYGNRIGYWVITDGEVA